MIIFAYETTVKYLSGKTFRAILTFGDDFGVSSVERSVEPQKKLENISIDLVSKHKPEEPFKKLYK
ncbi:hypothetical protein myaer87_00510 [Microcystis aeruginosa NIES-87]|nr:hypothetical protein myaer87_00510 [Microcystis aeruginosa NIES-87]